MHSCRSSRPPKTQRFVGGQRGANPWVAKQQEVERLSAALQKTVMDLMLGPLAREETSARVTQLQLEFQDQIKKLYAM